MWYNSERLDRGCYKPNVTFHLLEDLKRGKVVFGTMFREFTFLNRMVEEGRDPVEEVDEVDLIEKLVNDFGYQLTILGRDENFNKSEFVEFLK